MLKFDQAVVQSILEVGDAEKITITGQLVGGTTFGGFDTVRVIEGG